MRLHHPIPAVNARPFPLRSERVRIHFHIFWGKNPRISLQDDRIFRIPDLIYIEVHIVQKTTEKHTNTQTHKHTVFVACSRRQQQWRKKHFHRRSLRLTCLTHWVDRRQNALHVHPIHRLLRRAAQSKTSQCQKRSQCRKR